jgi:hypothetical protein
MMSFLAKSVGDRFLAIYSFFVSVVKSSSLGTDLNGNETPSSISRARLTTTALQHLGSRRYSTTLLLSTLLLVSFINMAGAVSKMMDKLFASCSGDPKGSVHRAWGLTLLFVLGYFIFSIFESTTRKT